MARPWIYFPPDDESEGLAAKHRLADALRALVEDALVVDASSGAELLDQVTAAVEVARAMLGGAPTTAIDTRGADIQSSLAERSPYVGRSNALAAPLRLDVIGDRVVGRAVYGRVYEGGIGDMHGGAVMAAFDDLLGCAQMLGPVVGRTGTLTVRFRATSPIGERIEYEGWLERVEGRKAFCRGVARSGGTLLAEAEAVFVAPPPVERST